MLPRPSGGQAPEGGRLKRRSASSREKVAGPVGRWKVWEAGSQMERSADRAGWSWLTAAMEAATESKMAAVRRRGADAGSQRATAT